MDRSKAIIRVFLSLVIAAVMSGVITANNPPRFPGELIKDDEGFSEWQVVGPDGGDVRSIAVDPRDKNRLYISTLDGQVYLSTDAARSWKLLVNLNEPQLVLDQLMVDLTDSKRIYTSGHRHNQPGGFFYSKDAGLTWSKSKDLEKQAIHSMTQSDKDPNIITVGTLNGVWISHDRGEKFEKIQSASMPVNINSMAIDPTNTSTIYAGTWWRPYKSTDSGKSWRLIKTGMIDDSDVFAITINSDNPQHLIASACSGIYESYNGGEKWAKIQGIPSQSRRTRDILQHPSVKGTVYAGTTEGFWMTSNGGKSWALTTQRNLEVNSIAVHPDEPQKVFIATNNFGVMISNDGGRNFTPTNSQFTSRFTYSITQDRERPNRLYATTHNTGSGGGFFFISDDGGRTWMQAKNLDINKVSPYTLLQDRENGDWMYLGTNLGIFSSTDRGLNWTLLTAPKKAVIKPKLTRRMTAAQRKAAIAAADLANKEAAKKVGAFTGRVKVLAYTEDDKNGILAGTDSGLYRTYELAKGWDKLEFGEGIDEDIFAIHSSNLVPGTIWAGTATSGVVVSTDDGATWTKTGGAPDRIPVSSIAVDPKRPNYIYVGTRQSFYLSRDGGRTWQRRGGRLPLGNFTSILIDPNNTDEMFVSSSLESDGGIFYSDDAGMNWKRVDTKDMKVPSRRVWSMTFDNKDPNLIYAGSHSSGVYRIRRTESVAAKE